MNRHLKKQNGFALFVAVTLVSVLLLVVFAVSNFAYKQLQLSSLGKDSISSFFAAESGMECARYFDTNGDYFSTSTVQLIPGLGSHTSSSPFPIERELSYNGVLCGDISKTPTLSSIDVDNVSNVSSATTTLHVYYGVDLNSPCAKIIVAKSPYHFLDSSDSTHTTYIDGQKTLIISRGYNICDPASARRRTERAIQYVYWK